MNPRLSRIAQVFGLVGFAVAQPTLDVLARQPTFFVAHDVGGARLVVFALSLVLVPTAAIAVLAEASRIFSARFASGVYAVSIGILVAIALLPGAGLAGLESHESLLIAFGACALAAAALYLAVPPAGRFLSILAVFGVVSPLLFLANPSIRPLLSEQRVAASGAVVRSPAPVVLLILDGLRLVELLDERGEIDAARFPNFARLGRTSTWYRNATSVAAFTHEAVPAILTGLYPTTGDQAPPTAATYPNNLFSLLGGAYEMFVHEPVTALCSVDLCPDAGERRPDSGIYPDAAIVWLHVIAPPVWREHLPDISGKWSGFGSPATIRKARIFERALESEDRSDAFLRSLEQLNATAKPALYVHHTMLPHNPFEYLPSGARYRLPEHRLRKTFDGYVWANDPLGVRFEEGLYVLQLAYADELLGRLFDRLEALGILDSALVVVTADHGFAFIPGISQRHHSMQSGPDIMPVPLFVKLPGQRQPAVSEKEVETIDILPTIADVLGVELPWRVDGVALTSPAAKQEKRFLGGNIVRFTSMAASREDALKRKLANVGAGKTAYDALVSDSSPAFGEKIEDVETDQVPFGIRLEHRPGQDGASRYLVDGSLFSVAQPPQGLRALATVDGRVVGSGEVFQSSVTQYNGFELLLNETLLGDRPVVTPEILLWDPARRRALRPYATTSDSMPDGTDAAAKLWGNVWIDSTLAYSCTPPVRALFDEAYRAQSIDLARAPYKALKQAVRACLERGTPNASNRACLCGPFTEAIASPASAHTEPPQTQADPSELWDVVWQDSTLKGECAPTVRAEFSRLYQTLRESSAEIVPGPFEILQAAMLTCRLDAAVPGADAAKKCGCGSSAPDLVSQESEAPQARADVERRLLVGHLRRNGLLK